MYLPGPTTICLVRAMPRESWLRAQKRHFPDITNYSKIAFVPSADASRKFILTAPVRSEKRHYCNTNYRDHMKDFF